MTEPITPPPIAHDPLTSILVMLTELRKDVQAALAQQSRHDTTLSEHGQQIDAIDSRVTVLETERKRDDRHESDRLSRKTLLWSAVAALAVLCGTIVALIVALHQGG